MSLQTIAHRRALRRRRARRAEAAADQAAERARRAPYGLKGKLQAAAIAARTLALRLGRVAR